MNIRVFEVKCSAKECKKKAVWHINCDGLETSVCDDHKDAHYGHFLNRFVAQRIEEIVMKDENHPERWE